MDRGNNNPRFRIVPRRFKGALSILSPRWRAFREAFLALPAEEYDWFDIHSRAHRLSGSLRNVGATEKLIAGVMEPENNNGKQRRFFEFAGPLFTAAISPASSVVRVGEQRSLRALPYDRSRRRVETELTFAWE